MTNHRFNAVAIAIAALGLVACGETAEPDDTAEQRSGLDLDPLEGLDIDDGPAIDDVDDKFQDHVADTLEDIPQLLWYDGDIQEGDDEWTYTYRADVEPMAALTDDEFGVAARVLGKRNDVSNADEGHPGVGGGYDGDEYFHEFYQYVSYDPDAPADPDVDIDVDARIEAIEAELDTALEPNDDPPVYDDEGRPKPTIEFDVDHYWFYHVDVFEPDELTDMDTARDAGNDRAPDALESDFDEFADKLDDLAGCVEHDRSAGDGTATFGCPEDSIYELTEMAEEIEAVQLVEQDDEVQNINTGDNSANGTDNQDAGSGDDNDDQNTDDNQDTNGDEPG